MKTLVLASSLLLATVSMSAFNARLQQPAAAPQAPQPPLQLSPLEMELYRGAQTLIDWTPDQIHDFPLLHNLRPAANQDELPMVLARVGQTVTLLFHDFPEISCDEEVISKAKPGRVRAKEGMREPPPQHRKFRYIVMSRPYGDFPRFEEYRTDFQGNLPDTVSLSGNFLITSNFAATCVFLSTANQPDSGFRDFGIQVIRNRECHAVGFAQNPEKAHSVGVLRLPGKTVPLLVQGLAWIDSETFQILRVTTWLLAPRMDIGLSSETSTVDFFPVHPSGSERVLWLPGDVAVELDCRGVKYRNMHHYSNFKLFRVETTIKPGP